jgi:hypothetical protein
MAEITINKTYTVHVTNISISVNNHRIITICCDVDGQCVGRRVEVRVFDIPEIKDENGNVVQAATTGLFDNTNTLISSPAPANLLSAFANLEDQANALLDSDASNLVKGA